LEVPDTIRRPRASREQARKVKPITAAHVFSELALFRLELETNFNVGKTDGTRTQDAAPARGIQSPDRPSRHPVFPARGPIPPTEAEGGGRRPRTDGPRAEALPATALA